MKKDLDFYEDIISFGLIVTHQLHMSVVVSGDKSPFERPPREKQSYTSKYIDGGEGRQKPDKQYVRRSMVGRTTTKTTNASDNVAHSSNDTVN